MAVDTLLPTLGPKGECAADGVAEQLHPYPLLVSGKTRVGFKVGRGCFIINHTTPLGLHMLLVLCKSVLRGTKILLFLALLFTSTYGKLLICWNPCL